jgi:hypothetical protein
VNTKSALENLKLTQQAAAYEGNGIEEDVMDPEMYIRLDDIDKAINDEVRKFNQAAGGPTGVTAKMEFNDANDERQNSLPIDGGIVQARADAQHKKTKDRVIKEYTHAGRNLPGDAL